MHKEVREYRCALQTVEAESVICHLPCAIVHSYVCTERNVNVWVVVDLRMGILAEQGKKSWTRAHISVAEHVDEGEETNGISCECR